jgi:protein phosphatase
MLTILAEPSADGSGAILGDSVDGTAIGLDAFGLSDIGRTRENNDDRFIVATLERKLAVSHSNFPGAADRAVANATQAWLFAVADGVGGIAGGEVASAIAIDSICAHALRLMPWASPVEPSPVTAAIDGLRRAVAASQRRMQRIAESRGMDTRLGTTLTLALVAWPELLVVHVGDSRAYVLDNPELPGGALHRLTRDHTLAEVLRAGGIDVPEAAESGPAGFLVNAIGGGSDELDIDIVARRLAPGARLLLATDGLTRYIDDIELAQRLATMQSADTVARELVGDALSRGGEDNVTVVLAAFHERVRETRTDP